MDARTALKNYTTMMIKTYGAEYWEHWTEDDKETFNILAARVRPEITPNDKDKRSNFMKRFLGIRVGGVERAPERKEAWDAAARTAAPGSKIKGTLSPQSGLYDGAQPKRRKLKKGAKISIPDAVVETSHAPMVDKDSEEYVTGVTAADLLHSIKFSH